MNIPEDLIIRPTFNKEIEMAGRLEAEMTFMKVKDKGEAGYAVVYCYPELVKNKHDLFSFAMYYGIHMANLQSGLTSVSKQVIQIFEEENKKS